MPAIVLSSHTSGMGVISALGLMGVPVVAVYYEEKDMGYVSRYVKERIRAPHPEKHESEFISLLLDKASRYPGCLLVPADDETLGVVSRHKTLLGQHYIVACTGWEVVERLIDKKYIYALADAIGIATPKTLVPGSVEDVENYGRNIEYPCVVKPCQSHRYFEAFRVKMVCVENLEHMLSVYKQAAAVGIEIMLQEYIPGDDSRGVNYNSYFWNGEPLVEFTAQKVRLSPPGFGVPRVVWSKDIPEIIEPGRKILKALNYYGYSCTEFKKDPRDSAYKFMEVNGRHNRSTLLSVRCGINFPWLEYRHLMRGELPAATGYRTGVYWIDEFRDIFSSAKYRKEERYPLGHYIRPYVRPHVFSVLHWKDPMPFVKRCVDSIKMVSQHVLFFLKNDFPRKGVQK